MTPFEQASQLYYDTATHSALRDLGDQGAINAGRMFELARDQKLSEMEGQRQRDNMQMEANLAESRRLKLKNEAAQQVFATVQQRHPDWKPDPGKSLEENVASAQSQNDSDTMEGVNSLAGIMNKSKDEKNAILAKYGAFQAPDPTLVNRQLVIDPSLTTGTFPVLGPKHIQMLNANKSPEEVAKDFFYESNKQKLLNAANNVRQAIQQRQMQLATEKAQVELQGVDSKYAPYNQISSDLLGTISKNQPWLLSKAAVALGQNSTPTATGNGIGANGLLDRLTDKGGNGNGNPPPPPAADTPVPPGTPTNLNPNFYAHKAALAAAQETASQKQSELEALDGKLQSGGYSTYSAPAMMFPLPGAPSSLTLPQKTERRYTTQEMGDFAKQRLKAQKALESARQDVIDHQHALDILQPRPGFGDLKVDEQNEDSGGALPPMPSTQGLPPAPPTVPQQPTNAFPSAPMTQPTNAPSASNVNLGNATQALQARNTLMRVFGTADQTVLQKAKDYSHQVLGLSDDQLNQGLQAALNGDPNAIAQARKVISIVSGAAPAMPDVSQNSDQSFSI